MVKWVHEQWCPRPTRMAADRTAAAAGAATDARGPAAPAGSLGARRNSVRPAYRYSVGVALGRTRLWQWYDLPAQAAGVATAGRMGRHSGVHRSRTAGATPRVEPGGGHRRASGS